MTNLLKAETYKLQRNKAYWVIFGIVGGISILMHLLILTDWWMISGTPFDSAGLSELNALSAFIVPLFFNLIVSSLAGFFISKEFSNSGVIRNQIISGNKRSHIFLAKYLVFSVGSITVTILIPLLTAIMLGFLFGQGEIFDADHFLYLGRAFGLFTLQFLGFTAIITLLAIITNDSGKTIIFSILFTIVMFVLEQFAAFSSIGMVFEYTIFQQFGEVFNYTMTNAEIIKASFIGIGTIIVILICSIIIFNKKEIK